MHDALVLLDDPTGLMTSDRRTGPDHTNKLMTIHAITNSHQFPLGSVRHLLSNSANYASSLVIIFLTFLPPIILLLWFLLPMPTPLMPHQAILFPRPFPRMLLCMALLPLRKMSRQRLPLTRPPTSGLRAPWPNKRDIRSWRPNPNKKMDSPSPSCCPITLLFCLPTHLIHLFFLFFSNILCAPFLFVKDQLHPSFTCSGGRV